ncbi:antitoxin Xre/MbcA/ParS toxin-binding domain-containing protein [Caulobacter sp. LjRoot300]|uniref:antitoxin Xre/MbcA/ParS toxin-binding domain-containing protein n=1 Tax=Caulobacter sp. LjRoot300 TaxID=3342321 RepID=UPI003ECC6E5D
MPSQASRRKPPAAHPAKAAVASAGASPTVVDFMAADGRLDLDRITTGFNLTKSQLAETAGLASDTLQKSARRDAPKTQARMTEMLEILSRLETWAGGRGQALAWYRAQPIAALDGRTAEALVKSGKAGLVRDYLDHLALGGFA